jgi:hypothetical protein
MTGALSGMGDYRGAFRSPARAYETWSGIASAMIEQALDPQHHHISHQKILQLPECQHDGVWSD